MTEQALTDWTGCPLGVDSFVRVELQSRLMPGQVVKFVGLVAEIGADAKGPTLTVREWARGRFTGRTRTVRPEHCAVESRAPRELLRAHGPVQVAPRRRVVRGRGGR